MPVSTGRRLHAAALTVMTATPLAVAAWAGPSAHADTAACPAAASQPGVFTDVPAGDAHAGDVSCAAYWGVTTGTGAGRYTPTAPVTREQMATFVVRLIHATGGTLPAATSSPFTDVPTSDAHAADVTALAAAHVTGGETPTRFDPTGVVTRNQMASFLVRAWDYRTNSSLVGSGTTFSDIAGDAHARDITAAASAGFAGGYPDGTYRPTAQVTREQMASFVARVLDRAVTDGLATVPTTSAVPKALPSLTWPIRLAFYYPFYPAGFVSPGSHFHPTDGQYSSDDVTEVRHQVAAMRYAGMNGAVFSWWGQGHPFSARLPVALEAAHGTPFRWTVYYEPEGQGNPSAGQIASDLDYLYTTAAGDPNFLRIDGRPVIFVWPDPNDDCSMLDRWAAANSSHRWYVVQKVFYAQNYATCAHQPDAWHQYAPAQRTNQVGSWSYSVSPGFWRTSDSAPTLSRSVGAFDQAVKAMVASHARFQLVTTWNEWIENTAVESAAEWASPSGYGQYADVLHSDLGSQ